MSGWILLLVVAVVFLVWAGYVLRKRTQPEGYRGPVMSNAHRNAPPTGH